MTRRRANLRRRRIRPADADAVAEFAALSGLPVMRHKGRELRPAVGRDAGTHGSHASGLAARRGGRRGHPPLLVHRGLLERIAAFAAMADGAGPGADAVVPASTAVRTRRDEAGLSRTSPTEVVVASPARRLT
jgi:hypothetical protein